MSEEFEYKDQEEKETKLIGIKDLIKPVNGEDDERPFLENYEDLQEIFIQIKEFMKYNDNPNVLEWFHSFKDLTDNYRLCVNTLTKLFKIEKKLMFYAICILYDQEEDQLLDNIVEISFDIIKNLIRNKSDGFLLSFIENGFIAIATEGLDRFNMNRLRAILDVILCMIRNYPLSSTEVFLNSTLPKIVDLITFSPNTESSIVLSVLLFYCTLEGAGPSLSNILNALEYLSGLRIDAIVPTLLYTASNITNTRHVAVCFVQFHNFGIMLNDALRSEDFDLKSAAMILVDHVCTWYYHDIPEDAKNEVPKICFRAISNIIKQGMVHEDIIEGALIG